MSLSERMTVYFIYYATLICEKSNMITCINESSWK